MYSTNWLIPLPQFGHVPWKLLHTQKMRVASGTRPPACPFPLCLAIQAAQFSCPPAVLLGSNFFVQIGGPLPTISPFPPFHSANPPLTCTPISAWGHEHVRRGEWTEIAKIGPTK
jgi:hypothetical protein